jgi:hypothetical protein
MYGKPCGIVTVITYRYIMKLRWANERNHSKNVIIYSCSVIFINRKFELNLIVIKPTTKSHMHAFDDLPMNSLKLYHCDMFKFHRKIYLYKYKK